MFSGVDTKAVSDHAKKIHESERVSANSIRRRSSNVSAQSLKSYRSNRSRSPSPKKAPNSSRVHRSKRLSDSAKDPSLTPSSKEKPSSRRTPNKRSNSVTKKLSKRDDNARDFGSSMPRRNGSVQRGSTKLSSESSFSSGLDKGSSKSLTPRMSYRDAPLDLRVFQNYNDPNFYSALNHIQDTLLPYQYKQYFKIASKYFSSSYPNDVTSAVLDSIIKLFSDVDAVNIFAEMNIHKFLPYDDPALINSVFNLLYLLFEQNPSIFQNDFVSTMSLLINKDHEKSLTLLSLFAKGFQDIKDPWPMLDLLFKYEKLYFQSAVGAEYISLLFFLNFTYNNYYQTRIAKCRPIFVRFLSSTDKYTVLSTYKAICAIYDDLFQIPMRRLISDLCDSQLCMCAISLMLRMKDIDPTPELIYPLIHVAGNQVEATLLLLNLLKKVETAKIMLMKTHWLFKPLPTIQDTLRLFIAIMKHQSLRSYISSLKALPDFLTALVRSKDKACIVCLGSIIKRLKLPKNILPVLSKMQFFVSLLDSFSIFNEDSITALTLNVIAQFASIGYVDDFIFYTDRLRGYILSKDIRVARGAFRALYDLSFYPQCALKYKELMLDQAVIEIFHKEGEVKRARAFARNCQHAIESYIYRQ